MGTPFGFHVIGGHTDSPNLKVKPRSQRAASGCTMLGVECYGGGLGHTRFDRDLSVSGRVLVQRTPVPSKSENNEEGRRGKTIYRHTEQRLINLQDPIAQISTLCIHLQSAGERKGVGVNKEKHTSPIIATTASATKSSNHHGVSGSHSNTNSQAILEQGATAQLNNSTWQDSQEPLLLQAIAHKLGLAVHEIVDFELNLYDTQPATLGGIQQEFVYSARLDNLATVFTGLEGLIDYTANDGSGADAAVHFAESGDVAMAVFFDHEEIGSTSAQGANSVVMPAAIDRITAALYGGVLTSDVHGAVARRSFILSVDQAHAIHPNYSAKHEANHAPTLNGGVVITTNSNQKYTTNGITGFLVREIGRIAEVPINEFYGPQRLSVWEYDRSDAQRQDGNSGGRCRDAPALDAFLSRGYGHCGPYPRPKSIPCLLQAFPVNR